MKDKVSKKEKKDTKKDRKRSKSKKIQKNKSKKRLTKELLNRIQRCRLAYEWFCDEHREEVTRSVETFISRMVIKRLVELWNWTEDKSRWIRLAQEDYAYEIGIQRTPFEWFCDEHREEVKRSYDKKKTVLIILGLLWKSIEDKSKWKNLEEEDKKRYKNEVEKAKRRVEAKKKPAASRKGKGKKDKVNDDNAPENEENQSQEEDEEDEDDDE